MIAKEKMGCGPSLADDGQGHGDREPFRRRADRWCICALFYLPVGLRRWTAVIGECLSSKPTELPDGAALLALEEARTNRERMGSSGCIAHPGPGGAQAPRPLKRPVDRMSVSRVIGQGKERRARWFALGGPCNSRSGNWPWPMFSSCG